MATVSIFVTVNQQEHITRCCIALHAQSISSSDCPEVSLCCRLAYCRQDGGAYLTHNQVGVASARQLKTQSRVELRTSKQDVPMQQA